jgi:hypothetical protein
MATGSYFPPPGAPSSISPRNSTPALSPLSPPLQQRSNALSNRLTSVLSVSYADSDIRDALETLSLRGVHNTAEVRRQLRLDVQKEVVDCNAEIVRDFGNVAEVSGSCRNHGEMNRIILPYTDRAAAIETHWQRYIESERDVR